MPLPINPPATHYVSAYTLDFNDIGLATKHGFWFWTYENRSWAVGPYRTRSLASNDRARYLKMSSGPELRTWVPSGS